MRLNGVSFKCIFAMMKICAVFKQSLLSFRKFIKDIELESACEYPDIIHKKYIDYVSPGVRKMQIYLLFYGKSIDNHRLLVYTLFKEN